MDLIDDPVFKALEPFILPVAILFLVIAAIYGAIAIKEAFKLHRRRRIMQMIYSITKTELPQLFGQPEAKPTVGRTLHGVYPGGSIFPLDENLDLVFIVAPKARGRGEQIIPVVTSKTDSRILNRPVFIQEISIPINGPRKEYRVWVVTDPPKPE